MNKLLFEISFIMLLKNIYDNDQEPVDNLLDGDSKI